MYDYESFLSIQTVADNFSRQIRTQLEDNVVKYVQQYVIDCDKDRLIKALNYDSDQYRVGFAEGMKTARATGEWLGEGKAYDNQGVDCTWYSCSNCGRQQMNNSDDFCSHCGAFMKGKRE